MHAHRHHFARRVWATFALGLLACSPALAAHPALWSAHDADTTVYFFGTVHVMKKGAQWHFPALNVALKASQTLYIEAADANPATLRPLVLKYGLDPAHPLSGQLDKADYAQLEKAATDMGLPGGVAALNVMRPWLAGATLAAAPLIKAGYDPKLGIDKQLQAQFKRAGKPVKGLESSKKQILILSRLPQPVQLAFLKQGLRSYAHAKTELAAIIQAWEHGNVAAIAKLMVDKLKDPAPKLYAALITQRNQNWSHQIAKIMQTTPGTVFVAVGSGHLAGPDRLQVQLAKLGIHVTRVDH